jgi:hypothetical protein
VEVPPRDSVLGGDHGGVVLRQRVQQRSAAGIGVGLQSQEDDVHSADVARIGRDVGVRNEVAAVAEHLHPAGLHRLEVRAAGDEMDIDTGPPERGTDVGADCAGAKNGYLHVDDTRSARSRRWILPVGPFGIASSTAIVTGTLNAAIRSRQ